jgi:hypothetical protein
MLLHITGTVLSAIGAVLGGALGYAAFFWIARQGFYALILPGALLGMGCGLLSQHRSSLRGVLCGLAAVALGLYTEWKFEPFVADERFGYLLTHVFQLRGLTQIMIIVGGVLAFWMGKDSDFLGLGGGRGAPASKA